MAIAEEKMNIPAIIDGDELAEGNVSDKQMVLYLSLLYNAFTEKNKGQTVESLMNKIKDQEVYLQTLKEENLKLKEGIGSLTLSFGEVEMFYSETIGIHLEMNGSQR
eukprot:TRINITY_DN301_c0_g1_i33.p1 TRINITY_DN301_c0_g1~~TRINITY_DN301_c0_g1_i33.p1  ORF type:complete len:107 (+),score=34.41 TRINITY_DN301_c0_g1_i33:176-496(+)